MRPESGDEANGMDDAMLMKTKEKGLNRENRNGQATKTDMEQPPTAVAARRANHYTKKYQNSVCSRYLENKPRPLQPSDHHSSLTKQQPVTFSSMLRVCAVCWWIDP